MTSPTGINGTVVRLHPSRGVSARAAIGRLASCGESSRGGMYREKMLRDNGTGGTIAFVGAFSSGKEEIQMDDGKWWTEADKGSGQVGPDRAA